MQPTKPVKISMLTEGDCEWVLTMCKIDVADDVVSNIIPHPKSIIFMIPSSVMTTFSSFRSR